MSTAILDELVPDGGVVDLATAMAWSNARYYAQGKAFGRAGDFITAPEVSQVFGEIVGAWLANAWTVLGKPESVIIAEAGPGRGTLMADVLRVMSNVPGLRQALRLHLIEISPALRAQQTEALQSFSPTFHNTLESVPHGPLLLVANEFLDALPVHQAVWNGSTWRRRMLRRDGPRLAWEHGEACDVPYPPASPAHGTVAAWSPAQEAFVAAVARRTMAHGGAALLVDYGPISDQAGESLQAVRRHRSLPVMEAWGVADLTTHVPMGRMATAAQQAGAHVAGPATQGAWLRALGAQERTEALLRTATPPQYMQLTSALDRLLGSAHMGHLFKVLALGSSAEAIAPGLMQNA